MAVPTSERGVSKLQMLLDTRTLALHTLRITANKNVFTDEFHDTIVTDITDTVKNIHLNAYLANYVRVTDRTSCEQRLSLQRYVILDCVRLIQLIQLSRSLYHLPARRVRYWAALAITARDSIRAWHAADKERYKEFI